MHRPTSFNFKLIKPSAPALVQMTVVHEPRLKLLQFSAHLPPLFSKASSRCSLLFGKTTVRGSSGCEARKTVFGSWPGARGTVNPAAPYRLLCGRLARSATPGLSAAPLARPIWAKPPWNTFFEVVVCHAEISTSYEVLLYPIFDGVASRG